MLTPAMGRFSTRREPANSGHRHCADERVALLPSDSRAGLSQAATLVLFSRDPIRLRGFNAARVRMTSSSQVS